MGNKTAFGLVTKYSGDRVSDAPITELEAGYSLALHVISQAFQDLVSPTTLAGARDLKTVKDQTISSARNFFTEDNEMLLFWCHLGRLNPKAMCERAKVLLEPNINFNSLLSEIKSAKPSSRETEMIPCEME